MTDISFSLPAKRRRGRPRKDGNIPISHKSPENPPPPKKQEVHKNSIDDSMVGKMVYGVIEGSFDAGFLVSVKIGNNATPFRGLVFEPKKLVPITPANDIAPQANMYLRREIPFPVSNYQTPSNNGISSPIMPPSATPNYVFDHSTLTGAKGSNSNNTTTTNGDMVATTNGVPGKEIINDKAHAVVSGLGPNMSTRDKLEGSNVQLQLNFMDEMPQNEMICGEIERSQPHDINFHQDFFTDQSRPSDSQEPVKFHEGDFVDKVSNSPNLNLDLASNIHGYKPVQRENPLLLNPDELIGQQPLEFMMERPKSPPKNDGAPREANLELGSSVVGVGEPINYDESGPYKLELGTGQSDLNTRLGDQTTTSTGCITDMDFVLSDVAEGRGQQTDISENKLS